VTPAVVLRAAAAGDRLALWRWRNDPGTRRASFDSREIPLDEHTRWLAQSLALRERRLWIVVGEGGADAGVVRLDVEGRSATVSIALAPEARGRGLGTAALRALAAEAFGSLGLATLRARVKRDNRASLAVFRRAGYAVRARTREAVELILAAPGRRLALIPARAGSKRFPGKNLALFDGRPLLARAVDVAREAGLFARIVVSTEDAAIARVAKEAGAEVITREARLAADSARLVDVCLAALDELEAQGDRLAAFCLLLPTSPFRTAGHIREAWDRLERTRADGVMSVAEFPHVPLWAVREVRGWVRLFFGRRWLRSRDRLPALHRHNGVVLWMRTAPFRNARDFYGPRIAPYYMDLRASVDIDHPIDLEFAEFLRTRRTP
jgi:CMP-N-acetylneuraminic acid synthetase/ribosomal protein S18 acetylase RimI-like enzyme